MGRARIKEKEQLVYIKNNDIGFTVDATLMVDKVAKDSMANGKINSGDRLMKIEGEFITNVEHFQKIVKEKTGCTVKVHFLRDKDIVKARKETNGNGYEFKECVIVWNPSSGQKLGLNVKNTLTGDVVVSRVDPESVSGLQVEENDRIHMVDGFPVTDKEVCKKLMVQGFRANNRILIKVERATADNTKTEISKHVTAVTDQEPSILMNSDVLEIAARQKEKGQKALDKDARKILKHGAGEADINPGKGVVVSNLPPDVKIIGRDPSVIVLPQQPSSQ